MGGNPLRRQRREEGATNVTMTQQAAGPAGFAPPRAEFRRRLLDGMAQAIGEQGFRESTVGDVVRHARTSRRTFYEHFVSKQECFIALLHESNTGMVRDIAAAVDPRAPFDTQVRQAIEAWIASSQAQPDITLSWIREIGSLGDDGRQFQRESLEEFVALIRNLTDTEELRAAGIVPPPRQFAVLLVGGLRELIATTVEDGADIGDLTDVAVHATRALLGPDSMTPGPASQSAGLIT
jgi:AcrR family transcriptional regulator